MTKTPDRPTPASLNDDALGRLLESLTNPSLDDQSFLAALARACLSDEEHLWAPVRVKSRVVPTV